MGAAYLRGADDLTQRVPCAKIGYASRVEAQRARASIDSSLASRPAAGGLRIYRCTICRLWHHGHLTARKIRRAMVRKARQFQ